MPALCMRGGVRRWRAQLKNNGRQVAIKWFGPGKRGGPEYRKAMAWEEEARKALEQEAQSPTATVSWTVLGWGNAYLDHSQRRNAPGTYSEKVTSLKALVESTGAEFPLERLTSVEALRHLDQQEERRSGNAANKDRKNLACAWEWGRKFLANFPDMPNPFRAVERYPEVRHNRYVPCEADFFKVLGVLEGQDFVMLTTLLHLGARRGEIFRLTWADVNFGTNQIRLSTRKTADGSWKSDWVPMTRQLRATLLDWWENRDNKTSEFVFTVLDHTPFTNQWEGQPFKHRQHFMEKACVRAGVKPFGFHAIRHLSATILYQAGYPLATIQAILRHENATTTQRYLKRLGLDPDRLREAVEVFENRGPGKVIPLGQKVTPEVTGSGG